MANCVVRFRVSNDHGRPFFITALPYVTLALGILSLIGEWRIVRATYTLKEPHFIFFTAGLTLSAAILARRWSPPAYRAPLAVVILLLNAAVIGPALRIVTDPRELRLASYPSVWREPYLYFFSLTFILACAVTYRMVRRAIREYRSYHTFGFEHRLLV